MSRIRGKDTGIELRVRSALHKKGLRFRKHVKELPGKPDIVFKKSRIVVFVDGDFWHGYRFPTWESKVSDFWKHKISKNRSRDKKNTRELRSMGWKVLRIWGHQVETNFDLAIERICSAVRNGSENSG